MKINTTAFKELKDRLIHLPIWREIEDQLKDPLGICVYDQAAFDEWKGTYWEYVDEYLEEDYAAAIAKLNSRTPEERARYVQLLSAYDSKLHFIRAAVKWITGETGEEDDDADLEFMITELDELFMREILASLLGIDLSENEKTRFVVEPSSSRDEWWVVTDTQELIVCQFHSREFNDTQQITLLEDIRADNAGDAAQHLSRVLREMADYLLINYPDIITPTI